MSWPIASFTKKMGGYPDYISVSAEEGDKVSIYIRGDKSGNFAGIELTDEEWLTFLMQALSHTPTSSLVGDITRFLDILNIVEVSDNDREFRPVTIGSCRVMLTKELGEILTRLEAAVGYKKDKA